MLQTISKMILIPSKITITIRSTLLSNRNNPEEIASNLDKVFIQIPVDKITTKPSQDM